jgi:hypothetical protein
VQAAKKLLEAIVYKVLLFLEEREVPPANTRY